MNRVLAAVCPVPCRLLLFATASRRVALASYCISEGKWEAALQLLELMPSEGVAPDLVTYNIALDACVKVCRRYDTQGMQCCLRCRVMVTDAFRGLSTHSCRVFLFFPRPWLRRLAVPHV